MKYHRIYTHGFKIHVSDLARAELGGEAALESLAVKKQLAAMCLRMDAKDYGANCPAEEPAENAASIAADYGPVTGFYHCAAALQLMVLNRQRPSLDHILVSARVRRNQSPPWLTGTPPPYSRTLPVAWPPTAPFPQNPAATPGASCGGSVAFCWGGSVS